MKVSILALSFFVTSLAFGQSKPHETKPAIDSTAVGSWMGLKGEPLISNDGNYLAFYIGKPELSSIFVNSPFYRPDTLIIQSLSGDWECRLGRVEAGIFSGDSKTFVFGQKDTVKFLTLGTSEIHSIVGTRGFSEIQPGKGNWVGWRMSDSGQELVLHNLISGRERRFSSISHYSFDQSGQSLMIARTEASDSVATALQVLQGLDTDLRTIWIGKKGDSVGTFAFDATGSHIAFVVSTQQSPYRNQTLQWADLNDEKPKIIWRGVSTSTISSYTMDQTGTQIVFGVSQRDGDNQKSTIWYFRAGQDAASEKVSNQTPGLPPGFGIDESSAQFSADGRHIFFSLRAPDLPKVPFNAVPVDVWNYKDPLLQSEQLKNKHSPQEYTASISAEDGRVVRLNGNNELVAGYPVRGDFAVVKFDEESDDRFWIKRKNHLWLVSLRDGSRRAVQMDIADPYFMFSPNGRYLVYFRDNNYYSISLDTEKETLISGGILSPWLSLISDQSHEDNIVPMGIAGWIQGDSAVLVYDDYDIWRLDLSGETAPVNVTGGYGRRHKIKFRITDGGPNEMRVLKADSSVLLTAFNTLNKYNGFCKMTVADNRAPDILSLGPWTLNHEAGGYFWTVNGHSEEFGKGMIPIKARDRNLWITRHSSPTEAPNYFRSEDLKTFERITNIQPQKNYNWLTTELVNYPQLDGTMSQGLLFKPEDFDRNRKYPVIILCYQQFSDQLYAYPVPDFSQAEINIPWFVSNGYLVFTPDIHFDQLHWGEKVLNSVEGAAKWLSLVPFINAKKIGLIGNSQGGAEVNYLVTHTHVFAAAVQGSAGHDIDFISNPFSLYFNDGNELGRYEREIGATLWQRPDLWIKHTAIFRADKVTTPLLIFHSKLEGVPFERAVEFFIALRRLGKKSWLLQYDDQEHVLGGIDAEDYTIRVMQFFDHYLKDRLPPIWMTNGIPAKMKGIEQGYELDSNASGHHGN